MLLTSKAEVLEHKTPSFTVRAVVDSTNQRLKVLDYTAKDYDSLAAYLLNQARELKFGKVWLTMPEREWSAAKMPGFVPEGWIRTYFGGEPGVFLGGYTTDDRRTSRHWAQEEDVLQLAMAKKPVPGPELPAGFELRAATPDDAPLLAALYDGVFETYPTPLNQESYIRQIMADNVTFLCLFQKGRLASAASAEVTSRWRAVEMTDCATDPEFRGLGLMQVLLKRLEELMKGKKMITLYTLARATSPGMNTAFRKLSYAYCGRLVNNCHICGDFEDMNLWVKPLIDPATKESCP